MIAKDIWHNLARYKKHYLRWIGLPLIVISFVSLIFLLLIPSDSKNAWIFGYSPSRIFMTSFFLLLILLTGWFTLKIWRSQRWTETIITLIDGIYEKPVRRYLMIMLLMLGYAVGSVVFWLIKEVVSSNVRFYAYAIRLLPLVLCLTLTSLALWFVVLIWGQDSPKSLSIVIKSLLRFLCRYPAYLFVLAAFAFAACGQLLDIELVKFLDASLLEEVLELFASISLLFASVCIYESRFQIPEDTRNTENPL